MQMCCMQSLDFLEQLLVYNPKKRLNARDAAAVSPLALSALLYCHMRCQGL